MKQINKYILEHFENSKFSILERLHITKNTGKDIDPNLSFDEFLNTIRNNFLNIYGKNAITTNSLKGLFINNFNKYAAKFTYHLINEDKRNNWRYNILFEYCEDLLKDPYPNEEYRHENNLGIIGDFKIKLYYHINFALDDSKDEYYIFCIDFENNLYEIYEAIN